MNEELKRRLREMREEVRDSMEEGLFEDLSSYREAVGLSKGILAALAIIDEIEKGERDA